MKELSIYDKVKLYIRSFPEGKQWSPDNLSIDDIIQEHEDGKVKIFIKSKGSDGLLPLEQFMEHNNIAISDLD